VRRFRPGNIQKRHALRQGLDRGQTVENQLQPLQEAAGRLGWTVVAIYRDEGISGTKGRDKRPGLDALLKGVARREFDIVAAERLPAGTIPVRPDRCAR
jgi:DNA invertase Pin-like site-specific DNA recombinase